MIYFSGHGDLLNGQLMLVLDETIPDKVTTYLPASWVLEARSRSTAGNRLVIFDCCHAGGATGDVSRPRSRTDLTEVVLESQTDIMLLASRRLEIAREFTHLRGSFLTREMCSFLENTTSRTVGLQQLMIYLNVTAQSHNNGTKPELPPNVPKVPIPYLHGDQQGEFYFTQPPLSWIKHSIMATNGTELMVIPAFTRGGKRAWCVGRTPVTNVQYKIFSSASQKSNDKLLFKRLMAPEGKVFIRGEDLENWQASLSISFGREGWVSEFRPWAHKNFADADQPVVCISFEDAEAYVSWLNSQSSSACKFWVTPFKVWNIGAFSKDFPVYDRQLWKQSKIHDKADRPASVDGAVDRSTPYGLIDMLGNVWEWCSEYEWEKDYTDKAGPSVGYMTRLITRSSREICGGSYLDDLSKIFPYFSVNSIEDGPLTKHSDIGFRVAATVPIETLPLDVASCVLAGYDLTSLEDNADFGSVSVGVVGGNVSVGQGSIFLKRQ